MNNNKEERDVLKEPFRKEQGWMNEVTKDIILQILWWIVITVAAFVYWMGVLFLLSIFLVNVWKTDIEALLQYGFVLTFITSAIYGFMLIKRKVKDK